MAADAQIHADELNIDKQRLGSIYAKALLETAAKRNDAARIVEELESLVTDVLEQFPKLDAALSSPRLSVDEKNGILDRVFADKMSDELLTFLKVVARHGRLDCLRQIRTAAREELNRLQGRVTVHVTTAEPLDDVSRQNIANRLQSVIGQPVDLQGHVDPHVIGGLVVRVGDTVYDGSVANRLDKLRRETVDRVTLKIRESLDRFAITG